MGGNRRTFPPAHERFWSKVDKSGECWVWTGSTYVDGYGHFCDAARHIRAHRWSWEQANGPIPSGASVLHTCDNPPCVRPDHLYLGNQTDNMRDAASRGRLSTSARKRAARKNRALRVALARASEVMGE